MIDIEKKIKSIEDSCFELAKKDARELEEKLEKISEEKMKEKTQIYKKELSDKYEKECNKLKKEYNKSIFEYEKLEKIKINNFKESLINNIKNKVESELSTFSNSNEYEEFLLNRIKITLEKTKAKKENSKIFIVEKDFYKFKDQILQKYYIDIEKIDNRYIGGCIVTNYAEKISVDNTIKTNIEEEIKKINF